MSRIPASHDFDIRSFVSDVEARHDARVGRSILSLMKRTPGQGMGFEVELAPQAMDIANITLLGESVKRILASIGLHGCSNVAPHTGKIRIAIPAAVLEQPAIQQNIAAICAQATERADADDLAPGRSL